MIGIRRLCFVALAASLLAPHAEAQFPQMREGVHLIAVATPDTVVAGPGPVQYRKLTPEDSAAVIYGQVMRVQRVGGADAGALPRGVDRVVLVPWMDGGGGRLARWTWGGRWTEHHSPQLYWATLRPREQWVDGMPTLDVPNARYVPYPGRAVVNLPRPHNPSTVLTAEQMFQLLQRLPRAEEEKADWEAAYRPVLEWGREHPELARMYPADAMMSLATLYVRRARLNRIQSPLVGTYRFTVSVDGDAPRTFFARARSVPAAEWNPFARTEEDFNPPADAPISGYSLQLAGAGSEDSLPTMMLSGDAAERDGYLSLLATPEPGPDGAQLWRGLVQMDLIRRQFPGDSVLVEAARAGSRRHMRLFRAGEPPEILATIVLRRDGSVTVEQTTPLDDGRTIVIRGERISRVVIPDDDPWE